MGRGFFMGHLQIGMNGEVSREYDEGRSRTNPTMEVEAVPQAPPGAMKIKVQ
jgi:hypothetical protein